MLADGGHCPLLDVVHQTAAVLPPEVVVAQGHDAAVVGVARPVVGLVGAPEGVVGEKVVAVGPGPVSFIA